MGNVAHNEQERHDVLLRLVEVAATKSARLALGVLALGSLAILLPQGAIDPQLAAIASGFGVEAFGSMLEHVASKKDISNRQLLESIEAVLSQDRFENLLTEREFQRTLARLFERQERLIRHILSKSEAPTATGLLEQLEQHHLVQRDLRDDIRAMRLELRVQHEAVIEAIQQLGTPQGAHTLDSVHPLSPTTATAPAPPPHFTGRRLDLDVLRHSLTKKVPTALIGLQGMAGIGKSALAQKLAAELQGYFSAGVFWGGLSDFDGNPLRVLRTWGRICSLDLSSEPDTRVVVQLVRDLLASRRDSIGPLMVIIDDVRPEWLGAVQLLKQAIPYETPFLLTTRDKGLAAALGAEVYPLDTLSSEEALSLLKAHAGSGIIETDQSAALALMEAVGYLPLAIELAGKQIARRIQKPGYRLQSLLTEVSERGVDVLHMPGHPGLAATFAVTYDGLSDRTRRVFRWLGAFPARLIYLASVAGVTNICEKEAEVILDELVETALLSWGTTEGTYAIHPLIHQYSRTKLEVADETEEARQSHFAYHSKLAQETAQVDAVARYGVTFGAAVRGQLSPDEAKSIYASLTGFSPEIQERISSLERMGRVQLAHACYVVHQGLWTKEQVEMIVLGSQYPEAILCGLALPHERQLFHHNLLHCRAALMGDLLDRWLSTREQQAEDDGILGQEDAVRRLEIVFDDVYYAKRYRCEESLLVPWLYQETRDLEVQPAVSFHVLIRPRDVGDLFLHFESDVHSARQLRTYSGQPTFILVPQDIARLPAGFVERVSRDLREAGVGLIVYPQSTQSLDSEAARRLARARSFRK